MATKPRHLKTATQLWVYDNAKRLELTEVDLARATGVEPGTARSWFSRGKPNADAMPALVKLFGRPAPVDDQGEPTSDALIAALRDQTAAMDRYTEAINRLVGHYSELAERAVREGGEEALRVLEEVRAAEGLRSSSPRARRG